MFQKNCLKFNENRVQTPSGLVLKNTYLYIYPTFDFDAIENT
jgi:hypothetical protein